MRGKSSCSSYRRLFFFTSGNVIIIIIIIIIGSTPRRAFQYLFTSDTFERLINVYKNNVRRNL